MLRGVLMSAFGTKQTSEDAQRMSAFGGKADIADASQGQIFDLSQIQRRIGAARSAWSWSGGRHGEPRQVQ
jgi:hypothetical protein